MSRVMMMTAGCGLAIATPAWSTPRTGTIAVVTPPGTSSADPEASVSIEAAASALGAKGFTILTDPAHAAYSAEVVTVRREVGTAVEKGPSGRALATGGGVSIPLSRGKLINVQMLRTSIDIRIRRRGEQAVLWHGAAITVRSVGARDGGADQVALALSQAALSAYPIQTKAAISIP